MLSRHRVSRAAIELIKRFEGYRRDAAQLPDGRWTIGYGHTLTAREGAEVSESDAEALLLYDLISIAHGVNECVFAPTTQNQFDALCSFAFNVGLDNFRRSQVIKRLNAGSPVQAACAMELWRKADFEGERIVVDALVRRRAAEKALFLTPENEAWVPAPSPVLRPAIDLDALDLVPLRRPVQVETTLEGTRVVVRREDLADVDELAFETAPEPAPEEPAAAVAAAAETVASRLETLFPDPGEEPEPEIEVPAEVPPPFGDNEPPAAEAPEPEAGASEQPAEPVLAEPEPEPELAAFTPADLDAGPEETLEIPAAPDDDIDPAFRSDMEPFELIPSRRRPPTARPQASVVWDLLLALSGVAFFGFGLFWGLNAAPPISGGFAIPMIVAWTAGLAGVGFTTVSVYHLLQRVGRESERD
ncbi:MAG: glycoside hydrolase family protein [Phenylobacterium sp.]|uniref:lysozyme n=1 Tax=Phenylobacterium sp. TaxID=1871053 RepID=UPI0025F6005B|nr:lysozyme [Phenylobacterium sp.]MBI1199727.1 glycoside hydrolase family protein [Phenylobacterium sp.]